MKALPQISEAEFQVMKIVWEHAPVSTNQVTEYLVRTTKWSPKTIQTMLKRLVQKKALTYDKEGRVFIYTPLIGQEDYVNQESRHFLQRFYNGNVVSMMTAFLDMEELSQQEVDELKELLTAHSS
ncbi:BlaI family transcriptional regulator, penicillinase repressor [Lachnospiraceae bacterium NLAE-zl-G231]|nr:BlaI family transcriptional regulator, penicillinase repressor [Lachnospiraceae bacterium NLAE-zl-G231]